MDAPMQNDEMAKVNAPAAAKPAWWKWASQHPYTVLLLIYLVATTVQAGFRVHTEWREVYLPAAASLMAGQEIHGGIGGYTYPPFMAMLTIPFTILPQWLSQLVWYAICCVCLAYFGRESWYWSGGGRLQGEQGIRSRGEHAIFLIACLCGAHLVFNALSHLQTDLLIAALILFGAQRIGRGKGLLAATCFGLATAIKCTPLLLAPYLAWRGKWMAALWLVVVAIGANLLPNLISTPPEGGLWLTQWYERYLAPLNRPDYMPGTWHTDILNNQSLSGEANRLLTTSWEWKGKDLVAVPKANAASPQTVKKVVYLMYLAVLIPSAVVFWRARRSRGLTGAATRPEAQEVWEVSAILLLMLLLSPNSSRAHFVVMLLPAYCATRLVVTQRRPVMTALLALAMLTAVFCQNVPGIKMIHGITLWMGAVMMTAVALLGICWIALWQLRGRSVESSVALTGLDTSAF